MSAAQLLRDIALVRDASGESAHRAFAAVSLAAGEVVVQAGTVADAGERMFGFERRHDDAVPWDGRAARSGTITYVDAERVEQYVGQQRWVAYRRRDLADFAHDVGDQVRIARRGDSAVVETTGPNRLRNGSGVREASSGICVFRTTAIELAEIVAVAGAVGERYGGSVTDGEGGAAIVFRGTAQLTIEPAATESDEAGRLSALLSDAVAGAVRLTVTARSNKLEATLDAERALTLSAAMLAAEADAVALDDSGAIFSADALYGLATRNEMRADAFAFAAAAARREWPAPQTWLSGRGGICAELVVFSSRPWRADFASTFLRRELSGLADGGRHSSDPIVPDRGDVFPFEAGDEAAGYTKLATLSYETVDLDVGFVDGTRAGDELRTAIEARKDVEALLVRPIAGAVVFAFGNCGDDTESAVFALEMRRAETLATTLAAAFAARGDAVAADIMGTLYSADELRVLALRRSGTSVSWSARVNALEGA